MEIWNKPEQDYTVVGHEGGDSDGLGVARGCILGFMYFAVVATIMIIGYALLRNHYQ